MSSICSPCSSHFFPKLSKLNGTRQNWSLSRVLLCFTDQVPAVSVPTFQPCQFQPWICIHYLARFWDALRNWLQASLGFGRCSGESFVHAEYQHLTDTWAYNSVLTAWLDQWWSMHISIFQKGMVAGRQCVAILKSTRKHGEHRRTSANISIIPTPWNISL